jgi:hypothetical protein
VQSCGIDFNSGKEDEGSRRAALAAWLVHPQNPLTWRSIANRLWHYHFGRGIVETPSDFGRHGATPTHPELLDWLASELLDSGGSLKHLHRLILCSATYRQGSQIREEAADRDAESRYHWRFPPRRLEAEALRDAVLVASGSLETRIYGPAFDAFRYFHETSPIYEYADPSAASNPESCRRTVYRFVVRGTPDPFLDCLDCPDANVNTPARLPTTSAPQALALLNNPFMLRQAQHFAERLQALADRTEDQAVAAYRIAFGRMPTDAERHAFASFVQLHGLPAACRVLFNTNEFLFVD